MTLSFFTRDPFPGLPRDVFAEFERLQRDIDGALEASIAGLPLAVPGTGRNGRYPALNVGTTPTSVEIDLFAPGIDPAGVDVKLDRGVLTIDGERPAPTPDPSDQGPQRAAVHARERTFGRFRRVVRLPDDIDPDSVIATYRDGVLHVTVRRREASQPRRIAVN